MYENNKKYRIIIIFSAVMLLGFAVESAYADIYRIDVDSDHITCTNEKTNKEISKIGARWGDDSGPKKEPCGEIMRKDSIKLTTTVSTTNMLFSHGVGADYTSIVGWDGSVEQVTETVTITMRSSSGDIEITVPVDKKRDRIVYQVNLAGGTIACDNRNAFGDKYFINSGGTCKDMLIVGDKIRVIGTGDEQFAHISLDEESLDWSNNATKRFEIKSAGIYKIDIVDPVEGGVTYDSYHFFVMVDTVVPKDSLSITDSVSTKVHHTVTVQDTLSFSDDIITSKSKQASATDQLSITDSVDVTVHYVRYLSDSITIQDSYTIMSDNSIFLNEEISIGDSITHDHTPVNPPEPVIPQPVPPVQNTAPAETQTTPAPVKQSSSGGSGRTGVGPSDVKIIDVPKDISEESKLAKILIVLESMNVPKWFDAVVSIHQQGKITDTELINAIRYLMINSIIS